MLRFAPLHPRPFLPILHTAETCTGQDLADLGDRLRDWFQLLHENAKQNGSAGSGANLASGTEAACSAWEEGGQWGDRCVLGQPALCSLLPDSEPRKRPKPQNKEKEAPTRQEGFGLAIGRSSRRRWKELKS